MNDIKKIFLIGNPNVGKSTIYNNLTNENEHTGNWTGKTVDSASAFFTYKEKKYDITDLPGTYSFSPKSDDEKVTRDYLFFKKHDLNIVVLDSTVFERNLNLALKVLELKQNTIICLNLNDEAVKKNIKINEKKLSEILNVPVVKICANDNDSVEKLMDKIDSIIDKNDDLDFEIKYDEPVETVIKKMNLILNRFSVKKNKSIIIKLLENNNHFNNLFYEENNLDEKSILIIKKTIDACILYLKNNNINNLVLHVNNYIMKKTNDISKKVSNSYNYKLSYFDKILTSKIFSIPIMILFFSLILWITIYFSNIPSKFLFDFLFYINDKIYLVLNFIKIPSIITEIIVNGILKTLFWVISVMLPPMIIFFPLFTLLEESGFLPRIAFNLDKFFNKAGCHGKQSLCMCMALGCNSCGVKATRIIDSKKERLIAILTNNFIPCNGRFPSLIAIITIFFVSGNYKSLKSSCFLTLFIILSIIVTLLISKLISKVFLKNEKSVFVLEIPHYRKPQIKKIIKSAVIDRCLFVLSRALYAAAPAGLLIWLLSNININNNSILFYITNFVNPFAKMFSLDGTILTAFILGLPANEIVIPIIIMSYMKLGVLTDYNSLSELKNLLINNGWTIKTALCTIIFILFHFPCIATLSTIKKEVNNKFTLFLSFIIPTLVGLILCFIINLLLR